MDKSDFYVDMLYTVQAALFRIRSEHSITALLAFTYGDLKDLEELLKNAIAKENEKKGVINMVSKEVQVILKKHIDELGNSIKNMSFNNRTSGVIVISLQDLLELRATCLLAYNHLTGVDLQEEPFEKGGD